MKNTRILTVRFSPEEERLLGEAVRLAGGTRSSLVREAVARYCTQALSQARRSPFEAVASRIGCARSGRGDLSARTGAGYRRILSERRGRDAR